MKVISKVHIKKINNSIIVKNIKLNIKSNKKGKKIYKFTTTSTLPTSSMTTAALSQ